MTFSANYFFFHFVFVSILNINTGEAIHTLLFFLPLFMDLFVVFCLNSIVILISSLKKKILWTWPIYQSLKRPHITIYYFIFEAFLFKEMMQMLILISTAVWNLKQKKIQKKNYTFCDRSVPYLIFKATTNGWVRVWNQMILIRILFNPNLNYYFFFYISHWNIWSRCQSPNPRW